MNKETIMDASLDLVPSLKELLQVEGLDPQKLTVAIETDGQRHVRLLDKHRIPVSDGRKLSAWTVPSLRELFSGDRKPPADINHYPPDYVLHFFFIETQLVSLCDAMGDRTDQ